MSHHDQDAYHAHVRVVLPGDSCWVVNVASKVYLTSLTRPQHLTCSGGEGKEAGEEVFVVDGERRHLGALYHCRSRL